MTLGTAVHGHQLLWQALCNISCLWYKHFKILNYEKDLHHVPQTDTSIIMINLHVLCAHKICFRVKQ